MAINFKTARDYVYANGQLWERALFAYLFQNGSLERLHQTLAAYKNPDGGFGHALEHDVRCPNSHPLALEFLVGMLTTLDIPAGTLLDGAAAWVEANRAADGSLVNPPEVLDYPHAPWWDHGGQTSPDSIVGCLIKLGKANDAVRASTTHWVRENLNADKIRENEWLFMAYHAYDYHGAVNMGGDLWSVTVANIIACAQKARPDQFYEILRFAPTPHSPIAQAMPSDLLKKMLNHLAEGQQADGSWHDEHSLPQWYPYVTIQVLQGLRRYGYEIGV